MFGRAGRGCVRIDLGAECGVVEKSGDWFGFEGERIGQGRENAKQFLPDHPDMARRLEVKVLAHHGIRREPEGAAGAAAAGGAAGTSAAASGGTVHALNPQPTPASEKSNADQRTAGFCGSYGIWNVPTVVRFLDELPK